MPTSHFRRFRVVIGIHIATILASMVVFAIALNLVGRDIFDQSFAIQEARVMQARQTYLVDNFSHLKRDAALSVEYENKMNRLLVSQDELINFPKYVNDLARVHAVGSSFSFQGTPVSGSVGAPGYVPFSLSVEGVLSRVYDFLNNFSVKETQFIVVLSTLDFNAIGDGKYRATFSGRVFFRATP